MAKLKIMPTLRMVFSMPEAMPSRARGAAFIVILVLGDQKSPRADAHHRQTQRDQRIGCFRPEQREQRQRDALRRQTKRRGQRPAAAIRPASTEWTDDGAHQGHRQDQQRRLDGAVATHALQIEDQQEVDGEDRQRLQRRRGDRKGVLPVLEERQVEHGIGGAPLPQDERHQRDQGHREARQIGRREPSGANAANQPEQQADQPYAAQRSADDIEALARQALAGLAQQQIGRERAHHADRQIDEEDPAPARHRQG